MDEQLLREFLAEADDLVESLFADVRLLRARTDDGRARRETLARIFRRVHTIKGTAAAAGLPGASLLAHELEALLEEMGAGRVALTAAMLDAFDETIEALSEQLSAAAQGSTHDPPPKLLELLRATSHARETSATATLEASRIEGSSSLIANSSRDAEASRTHDAASSGDSNFKEITNDLNEAERRRAFEASAEGARLYVVTVSFGVSDFDERFRALSASLNERGEIVSALPDAHADASRISFRIVCATSEPREELEARLKPFDAEILAEEKERGLASGKPDSQERATVSPALSSLTMFVRVSLEELDDLISAAHELSDETAGALDISLENAGEAGTRRELEEKANSISRRFLEFEKRLIALRMTKIGATLERAARAGASVARDSGKDVEIETRGGDVSLDRSLAEAVSDPLLHLLRNAVDHGAETIDERRAAGKSGRARVVVSAEAEGGQIVLRVADDGRGIDPERVANSARERGLIKPDERLDEEQSLRLIFRPGFSTARELSNVSGRGVGLDVVERMVESVGGKLRVWSRAGRGSTFEMRLPTTLALVSSYVARVGEHRYLIASSQTADAGRADATQIAKEEDGTQTILWRGRALPLVHLRELLGVSAKDAPIVTREGAPFLVSHVATRATEGGGSVEPRRVAVALDALEGEREILMRSLGRYATRWPAVVGATRLRDGGVALSIDLPRLLEMFFD